MFLFSAFLILKTRFLGVFVLPNGSPMTPNVSQTTPQYAYTIDWQLIKIHFGGHANLFASGRRQEKAAWAVPILPSVCEAGC